MGSTYLAIKVGVETIPPLLLAAARNLVARPDHIPAGAEPPAADCV